MAKKKAATPAPQSDATALAAIHWMTLMIEAQAVQVYVNDTSQLNPIMTFLRQAVTDLQLLSTDRGILHDGDCDPGWVPCGDQCLPMCFGEFEKAAAKPKPRVTKK